MATKSKSGKALKAKATARRGPDAAALFPEYLVAHAATDAAESEFRRWEKKRHTGDPTRRAAYDNWNRLDRISSRLGSRVLRAEATTPLGWVAQLRVLLYEGEWNGNWEYNQIGDIIDRMVRRAAS